MQNENTSKLIFNDIMEKLNEKGVSYGYKKNFSFLENLGLNDNENWEPTIPDGSKVKLIICNGTIEVYHKEVPHYYLDDVTKKIMTATESPEWINSRNPGGLMEEIYRLVPGEEDREYLMEILEAPSTEPN